MMELSIKARAAQAAVAVGGFMAFLAEVGAERDKEQQTKTRWALEYYAARVDAAPAKKGQPSSVPKVPDRAVRKTTSAKHGSRSP
jgi:hypothetical protein